MGWEIRSVAVLSLLACAGLATDVQAQQCRSDTDCEQGFGCRKDDSASDCAVPPSLPGEDPKVPAGCGASPMQAEFGECEPLPIACEADADCPGGLACRKSDGDSEACAASPGGDPAPECMADRPAPIEGRCVYVPVQCTSDRDCDASDACTDLEGESTCSSTPGVACTGMNCPPPPEPVCTRVERRYCFPRRVDCTTNAECGADRRCVALPEEIQEDAPEAWQGATRLCLEEGIALLVEGRIEASGSVSHESSAMRTTNGQPERAAVGDGTIPSRPTLASDDDCAVAAPGSSPSGGAVWLAIHGLAFALGIARRRG